MDKKHRQEIVNNQIKEIKSQGIEPNEKYLELLNHFVEGNKEYQDVLDGMESYIKNLRKHPNKKEK